MHTQPTIVIATYNRPLTLTRLLGSILNADYGSSGTVNLIISIDGGGDSETIKIANEFIWPYGHKEVYHHSTNLGLRKHIISIGNLTKYHEAIILLEDDCFVSKNFYVFAQQSLQYYANDTNISGISLYSYNFNETAYLPFKPLKDGYDVFFMQVPSSLGQIWTTEQWKGFIEFYESSPDISECQDLPDNVRNWPDSSWKKFFYKYNLTYSKYFVYPQISHLTNFGDVGTHYEESTQTFQVSIETFGKYNYKFLPLEYSQNKYDIFFELQSKCFKELFSGLSADCVIDLYGSKNLQVYDAEFVLSIKDCTEPIQSFGINMFPLLLNILYNVSGNYISYSKKENFKLSAVNKKLPIALNAQPIGFHYGKYKVLTSTYYKLGYYMLNPCQTIPFLKRKFFLLSAK